MALPSPRLLATHLPYSLLPSPVTEEGSECRLVYVCREPKDALVSFWVYNNKIDPTPRPSSITFEDLRDAFVEASKHQMRLRPKSPSREDMMRCSQEHDRKSLVIALNVYAKLNNMQV